MAPGKSSRLDAFALQQAVTGQLIGSTIEVLAQTSSTNDEVLKRARAGSTEGLVVFAEQQTAGRGQRGNKWESIPGTALLLSILLEPRIAIGESARLTEWAAQAIAVTIQKTLAIEARIKPPNDVYLKDRKTAGVLVEMRAREGKAHLAIVGIGINVNQSPDEFSPAIRASATSLAIASGKKLDRQEFAVALLLEVERSYALAFAL